MEIYRKYHWKLSNRKQDSILCVCVLFRIIVWLMAKSNVNYIYSIIVKFSALTTFVELANLTIVMTHGLTNLRMMNEFRRKHSTKSPQWFRHYVLHTLVYFFFAQLVSLSQCAFFSVIQEFQVICKCRASIMFSRYSNHSSSLTIILFHFACINNDNRLRTQYQRITSRSQNAVDQSIHQTI